MPVSSRTRSAAAAAAAAYAAEEDADRSADEYYDRYSGRHAFECISWSIKEDIFGFTYPHIIGYNSRDKVPDAILDDRAFRRGTFSKPFEFVVCKTGRIRARNLNPDISNRDLFACAREAVKRVLLEDGCWTANGGVAEVDGVPLFDYQADRKSVV